MAGDTGETVPVLRPDMDLERVPHLQPQADAATRKLFEDVSPAVVKISTDKGRGSGWFVDQDGRVITNAHVVLGSSEVRVTTKTGDHYRARIEKLDDINDLAVLKLEEHKTPEGARVPTMGASIGLKPDQSIYALGHPLGLDEIYISPGYFRSQETQARFIAFLGPRFMMEVAKSASRMTPQELDDAQTAMRRPLVHGRVHVEHGNSGGPTVDKDGKVVGVTDLGEPGKDSLSYFVPVEKVKALLDEKKSKFEFSYTKSAAPWAETYKFQWQNAAPFALVETGTIGALGYGAFKRMPKFATAALGAYGLLKISDDFSQFRGSHSTADSWKFGIASLSDLAITAGAIARFIPATRTIGTVALSLGLVGKLGSDFIPNRLVLNDIRRTDGNHRPPHTLEHLFGGNVKTEIRDKMLRKN